MKHLIKKLIPKFILSWYHLSLAHLASIWYRHPSERLIVIGVTGTNGKSTTVNLIAKILEEAGHSVAISSTVNFQNGRREWLNDRKMTMPGRFFLQKLLAQGAASGCRFAVIESSSEGILQHRQIGIHYDCMVFTNLTPEHLTAHGGWENYKQAKLEYFRQLQQLPRKKLSGEFIPKTIVANADDPSCGEFTNFSVDKIITFSKNSSADLQAQNVAVTEQGIRFDLRQTHFSLNLKGIFDVYNALAAIAVAENFGVPLKACRTALEKIRNVPGRMELIDGEQAFKILIDYAPEPEGLKQMYQSVRGWKKNKIIHVLGSTGGGRDVDRRRILGELAGQQADYVIVTNEDPYDDEPQQIIDDVAEGGRDAGKILNQNLFKILDRRQAIEFALRSAQADDLVIITGKGAEQKMAVAGGYIPWDDRQVVREELAKLNNPAAKSGGN
jgi:UDP-N-acetylmuramoyl-L-alanyl-D-glutamate--2,6-diaminopimelate ligase